MISIDVHGEKNRSLTHLCGQSGNILVCSGRSGGQRHQGRVFAVYPALDAGGQHKVYRTGAVALEISDAVQDLYSCLNEEISRKGEW